MWAIISIAGHAVFLTYVSFEAGRLPVATVSESLSTFVLLTAAMYWLLERGMIKQLSPDRSMGTFILPLLALLLAIANFTYIENEPIVPVLQDVTFEIHVLALLFSYGAFALSFIASLLHVLMAREIKKRTLSLFYSRLPSLAFFDRISNRAIDVGLLLATIGFIVGFYYAFQVWQSFMLADPKFLAALLPWGIYLLHFLGRKLSGWGGQRTASISLLGFAFIMFSFIVISFLFTSLHHFI